MDAWNSFYGILAANYLAWSIVGTVLAALVVGYNGAPLWLWSIFTVVLLAGFGAPLWLIAATVVVYGLFLIVPIRRALISSVAIKVLKGVMPAISETERTALEAGVVWAEGELFSGKPNFKKLMDESYPQLTAEEKAFMDGPVEDFCALLNDWEIWQKRDLPPEAFQFIKTHKLWGMIIPKEYGGLGFSAMAHSEVLQKISSRSVPAVVTIMVPNSLGPAELLIHYGTEEQRKHYLPRLATGEEIPCFALTEPNAGSDAGSIQASGELFKGTDGKLYLKLNWNKRWITLASISTTLGLAFRLLDPNNLLGKGPDVGITCALIPTKTPGVVIGQRHDPLGTPFYNCPTQGHDVIVSVDQIVGGIGGAGKGWKMLMECLAAGRGISLPSQSTGGAKLASRVVSIHATIRKQFGVAIGKFEGVEEPIARIAGYTYLLEALRRYTLGAIDKGMKPAVVTAIAKYHATEIGRKVVNDAMDVMGGAGISCGPRNLIAHMYIATPIGITVEGANIMTRTLIMFGQGALRAHPYAFKEVDAIGKNDLKAFDAAFWGHVGHVVRNLCRAICLSVTRAWIAPSIVGGSVGKYYRRLAWVSASFAFMSDVAMGSLGGGLKTREKITGRYADILAWMYIGTSVLRRFKAEGSRKEDLPFVHYCMNHALYEIQKAFDGIFANLEVPGLKWFFAGPVRAWSNLNSLAGEPSDQHTHKIATLMLSDSEQRVRLTEGIYMPKDRNDQLALLEETFHMIKKAEATDRKIRTAIKEGRMPKTKGPGAAKVALEKNIITRDEFTVMERADQMRWEAIQVDDFSQEEYLKRSGTAKVATLKAVQ